MLFQWLLSRYGGCRWNAVPQPPFPLLPENKALDLFLIKVAPPVALGNSPWGLVGYLGALGNSPWGLVAGDTDECKHLKQLHCQSLCSLTATKILEHWGKCLDSAESKLLLRRSEFKRVYKLEESCKEDSPARLAEIGPWCTLPRVHLSAITLRVKERNMGFLRIAGLCVCWFPLVEVG